MPTGKSPWSGWGTTRRTPEWTTWPSTIQRPSTTPPQSYGVMSWWDYGHMITYIAKRIPNANPFQQGVAGPDGSAAYFVATSEDTANRILDHDGTRYVVTDFAHGRHRDREVPCYGDLVQQLGKHCSISCTVLYPEPQYRGTQYEPAMFIRQEYYLTMVSRLHNFDGSMTEPSMVYYVEYADPALTGAPLPGDHWRQPDQQYRSAVKSGPVQCQCNQRQTCRNVQSWPDRAGGARASPSAITGWSMSLPRMSTIRQQPM